MNEPQVVASLIEIAGLGHDLGMAVGTTGGKCANELRLKLNAKVQALPARVIAQIAFPQPRGPLQVIETVVV